MPDGGSAELKQAGVIELVIKRTSGRQGPVEDLLSQIGVIVSSSIRGSFSEQKRGDEIWAERGSPKKKTKNILGLIQDLQDGGTVKNRRFDARPALKDTGRLENSIAFKIQGGNEVAIGTNIDYAQTQQDGGEVRKEITDKVRTGLLDFLDDHIDLAPELAFLLDTDEYVTNVKQRTIVSFTDEDKTDILEVVRTFFTGGKVEPGT